MNKFESFTVPLTPMDEPVAALGDPRVLSEVPEHRLAELSEDELQRYEAVAADVVDRPTRSQMLAQMRRARYSSAGRLIFDSPNTIDHSVNLGTIRHSTNPAQQSGLAIRQYANGEVDYFDPWARLGSAVTYGRTHYVPMVVHHLSDLPEWSRSQTDQSGTIETFRFNPFDALNDARDGAGTEADHVERSQVGVEYDAMFRHLVRLAILGELDASPEVVPETYDSTLEHIDTVLAETPLQDIDYTWNRSGTASVQTFKDADPNEDFRL